MPDHVHMLISIPPKYSVSQVMGFIKGKAAIPIARPYMGRRKNVTGQRFWDRGYDVTTVGRDEATIRASIQRQEESLHSETGRGRTSVSIRWNSGSCVPP